MSATSSPRMLHDLQDAVDRGVKIVTFNPLRERGLERFVNPQAPDEMLTGKETLISSEYYQVKNGGDIAALFGVCKALIEADDALKASGASKVAGDDDKPKIRPMPPPLPLRHRWHPQTRSTFSITISSRLTRPVSKNSRPLRGDTNGKSLSASPV